MASDNRHTSKGRVVLSIFCLQAIFFQFIIGKWTQNLFQFFYNNDTETQVKPLYNLLKMHWLRNMLWSIKKEFKWHLKREETYMLYFYLNNFLWEIFQIVSYIFSKPYLTRTKSNFPVNTFRNIGQPVLLNE